MATRNVVLTDHQEQFVDDMLKTGRFQNASEALRAGLRLLETEEQEFLLLQKRLQQGLQQAEDQDFASGSGAEAVRRVFAKA